MPRGIQIYGVGKYVQLRCEKLTHNNLSNEFHYRISYLLNVQLSNNIPESTIILRVQICQHVYVHKDCAYLYRFQRLPPLLKVNWPT